MTPRENLIRAVKRNNPEYVPMYFCLCPSLKEEFKKRTGKTDYLEYYNMPIRYVGLKESNNPIDYTPYFEGLEEYSYIDEWGIGHKYGSIAHFTKFIHPMANFITPEQVLNFPVPDVLEDYRWEGMKEETLIYLIWYVKYADTKYDGRKAF